MTINEAIVHAREVASRKFDDRVHCIKCAEEHEQLAEWLEELKAYRASIFSGDMTQAMLKEERNKAIDDFASELENHSIYADIGKGDEVKMEWVSPVTRIKEVAEQLKAGDVD